MNVLWFIIIMLFWIACAFATVVTVPALIKGALIDARRDRRNLRKRKQYMDGLTRTTGRIDV